MDKNFWNDAYKEDPDQVEVMDLILDDEVERLPVGSALDLGNFYACRDTFAG